MDAPTDGHEAARRACEKYGLNVLDAPVVEQMMRRPEACWAPCCGGGCIPCNDEYAAAAKLGRRMLREVQVGEAVAIPALAAAAR